MCYTCNYANKKSGTVAQTQTETLPDIAVQVWLVQLWQQWTEAC